MYHYKIIGRNGKVLDIVAPTMRHAIIIGYRALGVVNSVVRGLNAK
jgi:hypothetical protein